MINIFLVRPIGSNVGNEAIGFALRGLLKNAFGGEVNLIPVPATQSDGQGWHAGLRARTVHEMNLYGHGVVVGGGNLYENGQLDVDPHALSLLRPPLLLCSLSHGRIYDQRHRWTGRTDSLPADVTITLNDAASHSLARDEATLQHLRRLGIKKARLGSCPTLALADIVDPRHSQSATTSGTLISIRNPELMSIPLGDRARVREELERITKTVVAQGLGPVRLLCHDKRDMAFAATLDTEYLLPDDIHTYIDLLRGAELVVTFRLHAFLPCLSFGIPSINISYDERSVSMVRTVGLGDWDIDFVKEKDVSSAVMDRIDRLAEFQHYLEEARPRWADLHELLLATIGDFAKQARAYAIQSIQQ